MLIESTAHLPVSFAMLDGIIAWPKADEFAHILIRWLHFVGGITWIGMLYFFNLVNVPLQKKLDADTKKKVNPDLLLPALWYFRWGALVTVLAGLTYFAMYILKADVANANSLGGGQINGGVVLLAWLGYPIVLFLIEFLLIKKVPALTKDGRIWAVVMIVLVLLFTYGLIRFFPAMINAGGQSFASNRVMSIGVGGTYGIVMLLNVWGIIWPANKRIIGALQGGPAPDPALARQAFIASRTNTWLSLPMLLFMGTASHDWVVFIGK